MTLSKPDFTILGTTPNPDPKYITNAEWWLWLRLKELEPKQSEFGGILAWKKGFHSPAEYNLKHYPTNYSVRDSFNRAAPGDKHARALDWTLDDAQKGDFRTIAKYCKRLMDSSLDANDPRLDMVLYEWYGNSDLDREVEGYNEHTERSVSSDSSHLWHVHFSFRGDKCGDFWGMWALLTVLMGWSVAQWKASLPASVTPKPPTTTPSKPPTLPSYKLGSRTLQHKKPNMKGTDVLFVQKFAGGAKHFGTLDGIAGPKFEAGVKRYQRIRGLKQDGIVGPKTWASMGVR